jgi:DNA-binding MarR family transcriptional regulator
MGKTTARKIARRDMPQADAPPYRITDYPMHYIAAIQRQNQINLGHALRPFGLSVPMWRALSALNDKDSVTIGQLADLTVLDRSSLGRVLEDMAELGLIERESPPDDRRAVVIRISEAGRRRFAEALPTMRNHIRGLLRGVSESEFETLMRLLRRLKANTRMMSDVTGPETD